ncbi:MAG: AAA family ATPase [Thermoproteota archaeon]|nr:AAA family ATPase [Thermoproteota archaeon]
MKRLIILKGPMGSGKTIVGLYLSEALEDSTLLDLDLNVDFIIQSIGEALRKKNVVGEQFHGNSHTTDPQRIKAFQERDFKILSVILNAKLELCIDRVLVKKQDNRTSEVVNNTIRLKGIVLSYM